MIHYTCWCQSLLDFYDAYESYAEFTLSSEGQPSVQASLVFSKVGYFVGCHFDSVGAYAAGILYTGSVAGLVDEKVFSNTIIFIPIVTIVGNNATAYSRVDFNVGGSIYLRTATSYYSEYRAYFTYSVHK